MAVRHVARFFDLDWKTVKRLDRQRLEPTRKRVPWVGRGRGREDVRPFFPESGDEP